MTPLDAYIDGTLAGTFRHGERHIQFRYADTYLAQPHAIPLSASIPLTDRPLEHARVENYLWNLLPENPRYLDALARQFRIASLYDPLEILRAIGEDTPGALSFYPHGHTPATGGELIPLTDTGIARDITWLRSAAPATRTRLSLAGYQPKTAYTKIGDTFYRPTGTLASTHIVKPEMPQDTHLQEIEHILALTARGCHINAPRTSIRTFNDVTAFITERYDREILPDGRVKRLHQEDLLQAVGLHPSRKYQRDNGPGLATLIHTVKQLCPSDEKATWQLAAFNVAVGNADAHAKNYSFLITPDGHRLAPAYDLISLAPYPQYTQTLAMKIGRQDHYQSVTMRDWEYAATRAHSDPKLVTSWVEEILDTLPAALTRTLNNLETDSPEIHTVRHLVTGTVHVRQYTRKNGTTVGEHWRTPPTRS